MTDQPRATAREPRCLFLSAGVVLGVALTLAAANLWPHSRIAPVLFVQNGFVIGRASDGTPALCDRDGRAYFLPSENGGDVGRAATLRSGTLMPLECEEPGT